MFMFVELLILVVLVAVVAWAILSAKPRD